MAELPELTLEEITYIQVKNAVKNLEKDIADILDAWTTARNAKLDEINALDTQKDSDVAAKQAEIDALEATL